MIYQSRRWPQVYKHEDLNGRHPFVASQTKNTILVSAVVVIAGLMFFLPAYYFIDQNYSIFRNMAFDLQPQLVRHLEREILWIRAFMVLSLIALGLATFLFVTKITKNMMKTLAEIEAHMRRLLIGQWSTPHFEAENDQDIKELSMTYDYLHRSLKANTEIELKLLEKITVDPQNGESYASWKSLVQLKRQRLGLGPTVTVQPPEKPPTRRSRTQEISAEDEMLRKAS